MGGFKTLSSCTLGTNKHKSQLQTVLITASGPQAYNALVHRERYTQGSRQNRCVSSQEALALRAKVKGNREGQCPLSCGRLLVVVLGLASLARWQRPFWVCEGYLSEVGQPISPWHGSSLHCGGPKIANSELLTAGNPTV